MEGNQSIVKRSFVIDSPYSLCVRACVCERECEGARVRARVREQERERV